MRAGNGAKIGAARRNDRIGVIGLGLVPVAILLIVLLDR